jgi:nucleoside-diphosphate-sugar epimerase
MARALGTFAIVLPLPLTVAVPTAFAIETYWNLRGQPSIVSPDKIREAIAPSWAASAARARCDLDFAPAAPLDQRLAETVSWLRENGRL